MSLIRLKEVNMDKAIDRFKDTSRRSIKEKYVKWRNTTILPDKTTRIWVIFEYEGGGVGDVIMQLPAFRYLKRTNPNAKLLVFADDRYLEVYKYCRYIDSIVHKNPYTTTDMLSIRDTDKVLVVKGKPYGRDSNHQSIVQWEFERICNVKHRPNISLDYEMSVHESDLDKIEDHRQKILGMADGKKIVGLGPAFTFCHKMWQTQYWEELTDMLHEAGYFVVALGITKDLYVANVDFDAKGLYPIRYIPRILNIFDAVFVTNSGMLHIAGINQDVKLILIGCGPYDSEKYQLYRHGQLGYKMVIIQHNCPQRKDCLFHGFIKENDQRIDLTEQLMAQWKQETGTTFPEERFHDMHKYVSWSYCYKEKDRFECSTSITPEMAFKGFKSSY